MATGERLTWHRGSILPFASLWMTVRRVIALNGLRPGELPRSLDCVIGASTPGQGSFELLFNDRNQVDTTALASWLGEPTAAFEWSHLGRLPPWSRTLFTPGVRLCFQCLASGYHSALYSLSLLDACPLHGTELVDRCPCGRPFEARLSPYQFQHPGSCDCGALSFFSQSTCRRPTLPSAATVPLIPLARWLSRLDDVIRPSYIDAQLAQSAGKSWRDALPEWCEALELDLPECIARPAAVPPRVRQTVESGQIVAGPGGNVGRVGHAGRRGLEDGQCTLRGYRWQASPSVWTYRSMSRYLRRHVARRSEHWVAKFIDVVDPLAIARQITSNRQAMLAFLEMMWARSVEQDVVLRRWPGRAPSQKGTGRLIKPLMAGPADDSGWSASQVPVLGREATAWVEYQVARSTLLALWSTAAESATNSARSGLANWEVLTGGSACVVDWSVKVVSERLRFVVLGEEAQGLVPRKSRTKLERIEAESRARRTRFEALSEACQGVCLTWTRLSGWRAQESVLPTSEVFSRHRLLGLRGGRPHFWLFGLSDGRFVARLCGAKIQTVDETPSAAIEALRRCVRQYAATYGGAVLGAAPIRSVLPSRITEPSDDAYLWRVRGECHRVGFWRCASSAMLAARRHVAQTAAIAPART